MANFDPDTGICMKLFKGLHLGKEQLRGPLVAWKEAWMSMKAKRAPEEDELSIRFVNTVAWRLRNPSEERLGSPEALLAWLRRNRLVSPRELRRLTQDWTTRPHGAAQVHRTALALREAIYALFLARLERRPPAAAAQRLFSDVLWRGPSGLNLDWRDGQLGWRAGALPRRPLDLLRPIALSAAALMTGNRAHKIRQCQDDRGCGWLFVDDSRLQNRRWCSMGDCGNIAKIHRHRLRQAAGRQRRPTAARAGAHRGR
jgi:predicted RNA-binding Zn ribbon-like protein